MPALILILLLSIFPLIFSFVLAFMSWDLSRLEGGAYFIGLDNFITLVNDARFWNTARVSLIFVTGAVTTLLPRLVGLQKAREMILFGERFDAWTALDLGLAWKVVPEGDLTADEAFTGDIYSKGAAFLHTLRWEMEDEAFWRATRRLLYDTPEPWELSYPIDPVYRSTDDFARIASEEAGADLVVTSLDDVSLEALRAGRLERRR